MTEYVVLADDVGKCALSVDDDKLIRTLMVPNDIVHAIGNQFDHVKGFRCRR